MQFRNGERARLGRSRTRLAGGLDPAQVTTLAASNSDHLPTCRCEKRPWEGCSSCPRSIMRFKSAQCKTVAGSVPRTIPARIARLIALVAVAIALAGCDKVVVKAKPTAVA